LSCIVAVSNCMSIDDRSHHHSRSQFHQRFMCSFYACRSQKRKKTQLSHQYLFTLLGSVQVKAVRRTLMKLSPARQVQAQVQVQVQVQVANPLIESERK